MNTFLQILLRSFETGGIYALAALGIIIIYRTSNMTNFAQGVIGMFNTFSATFLMRFLGVPVYIAAILGIVSAVLTGILVDVLIIRHTKNVSTLGKQIITLGLIMIFLGITPMVFGVDPLSLPQFIESGSVNFFGASISYNGILNISLDLIIMFSLFYFLQRTKWGLAVRTTASNDSIARLMGVPTKKVTMGAWAVAAALGTLAGIMVAPVTSVSVGFMDSVQINALVACILGGFQTFYGAVVGAFIIGISKNLIIFYISSVWGEQILYLIILIIIVFMPYGLFGKKQVKKV